jgi:hypothetical protein
MNVGPMGMIGSVAGSPLSQTRGADLEKATQDTSEQARTTRVAEQAEKASGIGQTEEDTESNDRDADGRRLWEAQPEQTGQTPTQGDGSEDSGPRSKDPTGASGNTLDVSV